MKFLYLFLFAYFNNTVSAQKTNFSFLGNIEFKDEFFLAPQSNVKYLEFHSLTLNLGWQITSKRFGLENTLGFEKSTNNFIRYSDNSSKFQYHELNRISLSILPLIYLLNKEKDKVDFRLGLKYYVNLNAALLNPLNTNLNLAKFSTKAIVNYSFKKFQFGVFGEYDLVSDYAQLPKPFSFGFRFGYIGI